MADEQNQAPTANPANAPAASSPDRWESWIRGIEIGAFIMAAIGIFSYAATIQRAATIDSLIPYGVAFICTAIVLYLVDYGRISAKQAIGNKWIGNAMGVLVVLLCAAIMTIAVFWFGAFAYRQVWPDRPKQLPPLEQKVIDLYQGETFSVLALDDAVRTAVQYPAQASSAIEQGNVLLENLNNVKDDSLTQSFRTMKAYCVVLTYGSLCEAEWIRTSTHDLLIPPDGEGNHFELTEEASKRFEELGSSGFAALDQAQSLLTSAISEGPYHTAAVEEYEMRQQLSFCRCCFLSATFLGGKITSTDAAKQIRAEARKYTGFYSKYPLEQCALIRTVLKSDE